jgi:MFS family permease
MFSRKILPITFLTFVNVINFSILIPVLPDEVGRQVSSELLSIIYGIVLSSYAIAQFFSAPILGSYSDKYGRKALLIVSQLGTLLSWILFLIASFVPSELRIAGIGLGLFILLVARIFDGLTGGMIP